MSEPIDVTLVAVRKSIKRARDVLLVTGPALPAREVLTELADEAEKLADYIGQPDMDKVALHHALTPQRREQLMDTVDEALPEEDQLSYTFSMQAVVDRIQELAGEEIVAYVEMTGGWVATIYAAARNPVTGDPILYQLVTEDWGRWPIMAGPGSFDPKGIDHVASLEEFFIGPDTELVPMQAGPPFPPPLGEYTATRDDDVDSLARSIIRAVQDWETGEIRRDVRVMVATSR